MTSGSRPRWHVDVPQSWTARRGAGLVVAAMAPGHHGSVTPHLVVGHERLRADVGLEAISAGAGDELASIADGMDDLGSIRGGDGRLDRLVRIITFTARHARVEVAQVLALVAPREPDPDGARDVIQVVGTCAFDALERHGPVFARVVESIRPTQWRTGE